MLTIHTRYFASLKEHRGCSEESLSVENGTTTTQLQERLFPKALEHIPPIRFALNQEYRTEETQLNDGDEMAFFPPLGGG